MEDGPIPKLASTQPPAADPHAVFAELRKEFAPFVARLKRAVEPVTIYSLHAPAADSSR